MALYFPERIEEEKGFAAEDSAGEALCPLISSPPSDARLLNSLSNTDICCIVKGEEGWGDEKILLARAERAETK